jgi:hypothetical protein
MKVFQIIVAAMLLNLVRAAKPAQSEGASGRTSPGTKGSEENHSFEIRSTDGYCEISINTSDAPELTEWAEKKLTPVLAEWYPKLAALLPSDGYNAPTNFSVNIRPGNGVAATGRNLRQGQGRANQGECSLPGGQLHR